MKRKILAMLVALTFVISLVGCSGSALSDDQINMPSSSKKMKGVNYQEVIAQLQEAGFTNVETEVLNDLVLGLTTKDGEVEKVAVDGDTLFSTDDKFSKDANIIVTYHTFPAKEENTNKESEATQQPTEKLETKDEHLTVDNSDDLSALLQLKDPTDSSVEEFADKHYGQTVEFNGRIDYITNHGDYKTRWDLLVSSGDYDENTQTGPTFKFNDVGLQQLGIKDLFLPDFVKVGTNISIVAKIGKYDPTSGIFILNPISITER